MGRVTATRSEVRALLQEQQDLRKVEIDARLRDMLPTSSRPPVASSSAPPPHHRPGPPAVLAGAHPSPLAPAGFLCRRRAAGRPQCSAGGPDAPLLVAGGRVAARHRSAPQSARGLLRLGFARHCLLPTRTDLALRGTADSRSLLHAACYSRTAAAAVPGSRSSADPRARPADPGPGPGLPWLPTITVTVTLALGTVGHSGGP
jgi:hypothetical protein